MVSDLGKPPLPGSAGGNYFGALRRRIIYVATILPAVLFICVIAAFGIRPQYQATATILLEPSSVPKDIIESTVLSYSDQQIEIVQGRVMTVESLQHIVQQIDPYPDRTTWSAADKAQHILDDTTLEKVDPVTMKPQAESNAFSLHYNNAKPALALAIDERLGHLHASQKHHEQQVAGIAFLLESLDVLERHGRHHAVLVFLVVQRLQCHEIGFRRR